MTPSLPCQGRDQPASLRIQMDFWPTRQSRSREAARTCHATLQSQYGPRNLCRCAVFRHKSVHKTSGAQDKDTAGQRELIESPVAALWSADSRAPVDASRARGPTSWLESTSHVCGSADAATRAR